ncbi:folylpolyglutamate synthase/dihydrofolate synthase family protein [Brevundimonas sp. 2R-24]|uniref:Dihydrofolate synthase/folylpolyglutamate synthase n=1 Tax=Peiella sedimenti TaxID=3061083 RepID=A0ABT8SLA5_9CAUL|nr:folylpolyglutamate synthase/dihydrofolate synthase family protein [Caulobacteraceae bacterium XZ-24]
MRRVLATLGNPERRLPPVIHVAGTNGKGSTCAYLRAMAEAAGMAVHVYASPHLVRFNERIRLAGDLISDDQLAEALDRVEAANGDQPLTFFEATTAAAFLAFSETPADLLILEVGLGGVLDATNVIEAPLLSVITPVDYDHAEFLGNELSGIAREKAGIMKAGRPAIIARQAEEAQGVIETAAARVGAPLTQMGVDVDAFAERGRLIFQGRDRLLDLPLPALPGPHQIDNAGLAVACAVELGWPEAAIEQGLTSVSWPGRLQRLTLGLYGRRAQAAGAELWLDGGHNPHAAEALARTLEQMQGRDPQPLSLITGMLASKDAGGFFRAFRRLDPTVLTIDFGASGEGGSAADPAVLAHAARAEGLNARSATGVSDALDQAQASGARRILICGSLYLAGEVLGADPETWPR